MKSRLIDITGNNYGRLTVIEPAGKEGTGAALWKCRCECGNEIITRGASLKSGHTKSCGCYKSDIHSTHRKKNTRLYEIWRGMKKRCGLDTLHNYDAYGGRGITICDEWKNDFMSFYTWAMENGYQEHLTLDRKDNNGNYEPSNCKWSTVEEQANNRRSNRLITANGETHTIAEWARITGLTRRKIIYRIEKGLSPEKALGMIEEE